MRAALAGRSAPTSGSVKTSLRSTARRWLHLDEEIAELTVMIAGLTADAAPPCSTSSGSAPTLPPPSSSPPAATPTGCAPRPASPPNAGSTPYQPYRARPTGIGSTEAATDKPTPPSTPSRSFGCAAIPELGEYAAKRVKQGLRRRDIMRYLKRYIARELHTLSPFPRAT
jgi:hypothetical protein